MTIEEMLAFYDEQKLSFNADRTRWVVIDQRLYAAQVQISRAIKLYLDEEDYFCAITLAGAAHGLIREMLKEEYNCDHFKDDMTFTLAATTELAKRTLDRLAKRPEETTHPQLLEIAESLSKFIESDKTPVDVIRNELSPVNWLKHYNDGSTKKPLLRWFDSAEAAMNTIDHALNRYEAFVDMFAGGIAASKRKSMFGSEEISRWLHDGGIDYSTFS